MCIYSSCTASTKRDPFPGVTHDISAIMKVKNSLHCNYIFGHKYISSINIYTQNTFCFTYKFSIASKAVKLIYLIYKVYMIRCHKNVPIIKQICHKQMFQLLKKYLTKDKIFLL